MSKRQMLGWSLIATPFIPLIITFIMGFGILDSILILIATLMTVSVLFLGLYLIVLDDKPEETIKK